MLHNFILGAAATAFLTATSFGSTITLNPYSFSGNCQGTEAAPNSACNEITDNGSGAASYALNGPNGPSVTLSASGSLNAPTGSASGFALGILEYQMVVSGPGPTALVNVSYAATLSGSYTDPVGNDDSGSILTGVALAVGPYQLFSDQINVSAFGGSLDNDLDPSYTDLSTGAACSQLNGTCSGSSAGPQTVSLSTGVAYNVVLRAQAGCTGSSPGNTYETCMTSAMIDPIFTINSGQSNASLYSIALSSGVGNGQTSTVPEPGTWVLLAGGMLSLTVRRELRSRR